MMAPDYAHWRGMYEVADRFYVQLVPQSRELARQAEARGEHERATEVGAVIDRIMARPEHEWASAEPRPASVPAPTEVP